MKKIIAIVLAFSAIVALSFSVAAVNSPIGGQLANVTIHSGQGKSGVTSEGTPTPIAIGSTVTVNSDPSEGAFNSWIIYKADGKLAVEGTDYTITSGSLKTAALSITVKSDIVICGNYDGKITDPITGKPKSATSPTTGDVTVMVATVMMLGAAALVFGAKKKLCK